MKNGKKTGFATRILAAALLGVMLAGTVAGTIYWIVMSI